MSDESQTVIAQQAREIEKLREAAGKDTLIIVSHRGEINELKQQIEDLKRDVARETRERENAQAHSAKDDTARREAVAARREAEKELAEVKAQLAANKRNFDSLAEALRESREAWNEHRAQLLLRQGLMLDQLDRILEREGQRARDEAFRCHARLVDRCVLLDEHAGLHDDGYGTRWNGPSDAEEPKPAAAEPPKPAATEPACVKCQGEGCSRCVGP